MHATYTPLPLGQDSNDIILLALLQSRLQERERQLHRDVLASPPAPQDLRELAEVQDAAQRLSQGRYGLCAVCHGRIGWDLLLASPQRHTCAQCDEALEFQGSPTPLVPGPLDCPRPRA